MLELFGVRIKPIDAVPAKLAGERRWRIRRIPGLDRAPLGRNTSKISRGQIQPPSDQLVRRSRAARDCCL